MFHLNEIEALIKRQSDIFRAVSTKNLSWQDRLAAWERQLVRLDVLVNEYRLALSNSAWEGEPDEN